jgi:hypothetical protein
MKWIRWFLCKMDIYHFITEEWRPLAGSGLTALQAGIWGSTVKDGQVNYFKCRYCGTIMAPFEVAQRYWHVS